VTAGRPPPAVQNGPMDWVTVASLATAAGTLVLAIATFQATSSANRAARAAERALMAGLRPVLVNSRMQDASQKIMWGDQHWARLEGGFGYAVHEGDVVYLAMSVRNAGSGLAIMRAWYARAGLFQERNHLDLARFRDQSRDLYVAPDDIGFWQGARRDPSDADHDELVRAVDDAQPITVEVLYTDADGGQRTVSRFTLMPAGEGRRVISVSRHWRIDDEP
jgi:hypothetical protein